MIHISFIPVQQKHLKNNQYLKFNKLHINYVIPINQILNNTTAFCTVSVLDIAYVLVCKYTPTAYTVCIVENCSPLPSLHK